MFKILGGDLPKSANFSKMLGQAFITWGFGKDSAINLVGNIDNIEVVTEENKKKFISSAGWGLLGGALLGPIGLIAGALAGGNKKEIAFSVFLKDGRKFLAIADIKTYQAIVAASMK